MAAKEIGGTLESLVKGEKGKREPDTRVYFLSEVAWDSDYFEQSEKNKGTYTTLLKFLSSDPELTGIVIDGALSRLDRPEFLNSELTYWDKSLEECEDATKSIHNRRQYKHMADKQFEILEKRLEELRKTLPKAKLYLNVFNDDVQYTATTLVHEELVSAGGSKDELSQLKGRKQNFLSIRKQVKKELKSVENKSGKKYRDKRSRLKRKLTGLDHKIAGISSDEGPHEEQVAMFLRPKKGRPIHQYTKGDIVNDLIVKYKEICGKHGVELITNDAVLDIDGFKIDYSHNRHDTWNPINERHKKFVDSTHGRAKDFEGLDAIVEGGHHGKGQKTLQKLELIEEEINFKQHGDFNGKVGTKYITIFSAPPFEDQAELSKYLKGENPKRMGAGKPMNTTSHHGVKRVAKGGVAGLGMLRKDADGEIHAEMAFMQKFIDGSILKQPDVYNIVGWTSDEHIGAKESLPILRVGFIALYNLLLDDNPLRIRGKPVRMVGYGSGGDTAENNAGSWPDKSHDMRDPLELFREYITELSDFINNTPTSEKGRKVYDLSSRFVSEASSGSVQSLRIIKDWVANYYNKFLELNLSHGSRLKHLHVSVPGNHADSRQRDISEKETDHFVHQVKSRGIGVYETGIKPSPKDKDARVYVGGGDYAHVLLLEDYGATIDGGKPLFGPVKALLQHDPKSGEQGLDGAGATVNADIGIAGHTHEIYMKMVNGGSNKGWFSDRIGTINGVDPTQVKYAQTVQRTQGAHAFTMPGPMEIIEFTFPAPLLKRLGEAQLLKEAEEKSKKK